MLKRFEQTCLPLWSMGVESTWLFSRPGLNLWQEVKLIQDAPKLSHWNGSATKPEWGHLLWHSLLEFWVLHEYITRNVFPFHSWSCPPYLSDSLPPCFFLLALPMLTLPCLWSLMQMLKELGLTKHIWMAVETSLLFKIFNSRIMLQCSLYSI